jgi:yeast amino acid transporter
LHALEAALVTGFSKLLQAQMDQDIEKNVSKFAPHYDSGQADYGSTVEIKEGTKMSRFIDSFRQNEGARMVTVLTDDEGKPLPAQPPGQPALAMKLKQRHLQMIAIGGSIGMGLSQTLPLAIEPL